LAHAFLRECSYKRLKLAQLLGQLGVFLTCVGPRQVYRPYFITLPFPAVRHDARADLISAIQKATSRHAHGRQRCGEKLEEEVQKVLVTLFKLTALVLKPCGHRSIGAPGTCRLWIQSPRAAIPEGKRA
jgi:hypothetical protein